MTGSNGEEDTDERREDERGSKLPRVERNSAKVTPREK
jgi:hypothetical protein